MEDLAVLDPELYGINPKHLSLILLPTERCNFRCTYCYENFQIGRMPAGVIKGIKNLISARANDLSSLHISWFGGEPLLGLDIIREISRYVQVVSMSNLINYHGSMTTNGFLLTPSVFKELLELGVRSFQISLDGIGEKHDATRPLASGKGTFDVIYDNLLSIREIDCDFEILIRCHFTPDNVENISDLIKNVNRDFSEDKRYSIFFKAVERLGGKNDQNIALFDYDGQENAIKFFISKLNSIEQLGAVQRQEIDVCYASKPNSLIIRSNGSIAKCTVAFEDDKNNIGKINSDGTISLDRAKFAFWIRGLESLNPTTLTCPLHYFDEEDRNRFQHLEEMKLLNQ